MHAALCLLLGVSVIAPAAAQPPPPPDASPPAASPAAPPATTAPAAPEDKPPELPPIPLHRLYLASLTIFRYNPLGFESQKRLVFQRRLMDSPSIVLHDTFVSGAASLKLNPAYLKIGPIVELQPLALLNVRVGYDFLYYFGSFGYLQSYPSAARPYSDAARKATERSAYSTSGHHVFIEPTLQAKVKSIALRSKLAIEYWNMGLRAGDRVFYDATLDTLVPNKGWVLANDSDLVYILDRLTFGVRFSGSWPLYRAEDYGVTGLPVGFGGNRHMRLGPVVAFSFTTREYTNFNKPTLLAIAGWYLDHPNREGALPYMLLGFSFSSDFLSAR